MNYPGPGSDLLVTGPPPREIAGRYEAKAAHLELDYHSQ